MHDQKKTQGQLIRELEDVRNRLARSEAREAEARQQAEEMQKKAEYFQLILDSMDDLVQIVNKDGMFTYANAASNKHSGFSPADINFSVHMGDLWPPEEVDQMRHYFGNFLNQPQGTTDTCQFRARDKDHNWHFIECKLTNMCE